MQGGRRTDMVIMLDVENQWLRRRWTRERAHPFPKVPQPPTPSLSTSTNTLCHPGMVYPPRRPIRGELTNHHQRRQDSHRHNDPSGKDVGSVSKVDNPTMSLPL
ncbi:hypothetical protein M413DRAFT_449729 [Hebeloma cylindrosporum]|uniref:Uncharacterized protein n=1 Tax=Hebeloma cylindrosporum TaxID=76867 RepID=A0A0C3BTL5_HEBCY|nr:hypothetical protein M413DRAFT_449729 [Hebeloma cylindrosporum h7]